MRDFEIGIIGGTGGIGRWFANFFTGEGYTVHVTGRQSGMSLDDLARICRVVIVSVPIEITMEVIPDIGPRMKHDSLFMDFTSLKAEPVQAMLHHSSSEVMGCHPLFGPDVLSIKDQNIVLCPVRVDTWSQWPKEMFENRGAQVIETTPERHDEIMAVVQGLNHFNTIMMGLTLRDTKTDIREIKRFSTPTLNAKLAIIEKIFKNPRLHCEIIARNPDIGNMLDLYEKNLSQFKKLIAEGDTEGMTALLQ
ncbi:MAG: prephenate dehydrogenase/arogenate dehydrogenase family protein [Deltaproteobacteria bacterium]|nr:prephenate dehydrogenase/arogenate dehydrogenase family protein [Deltaproteobacteria bacterium]